MFGNKEDKTAALLQRYGLESLSDDQDIASVRKIAEELAGTGLMEAGLKMSMAKAEEKCKISYLRAIMEQNFIMIRQLDRITQLLDQ